MLVRRFVLALSMLTAGSVGAIAADLPMKAPPMVAPPVPVFTWTGCYVGVHGGGAWGRQDADIDPTIAAGLNQFPSSETLDGSSWLVGGHLGCNYQFAPGWVIGAEGDWTWTNLNLDATSPNLFANGAPVGSGIITFSSQTDWLASIRGRFGYAFMPNLLAYVTGGAAFAKTDYSSFDAFVGGCPNCGSVSSSQTKAGWVAGGGLEYAITSHWLVRAEYLYYQFGGLSHTAFFQNVPAVTAAIFNYGDLKIHTARVGLSYKF
jgi:outer membrane immunogenic protein